MLDKIAEIRRSYRNGVLDESHLNADPIAMFAEWMRAAMESGIDEPNGMTLATVSPNGAPSARVVLLRGFDASGFVFFTNYESAKGRDLLANPRAAATFWWQPLERQIRIEGVVERISRAESEAYFLSRPRGHRLSAWASPQSQKVAGREELEARAAQAEARFPGEVPTPEFWGGYRLVPTRIEFWQGRENRFHDRFVYELENGQWTAFRLAP